MSSPTGAIKPRWLMIGLLLTVTLVALRFGTFSLPPSWDSAMSVWPAAFELSADWDVARVLSLPSFVEGGPNAHTLSLVTFITAGLLSVVQPETAFLFMHVTGVVLAVGLGLLVARTIRMIGNPRLAIWGAILVVVFPMIVGQSAYLYTELPSAFLAFLATLLALEGRRAWSVAALVLAVLTKPLAIVVIPAVALILWRRSGKALVAGLPAIALAGVIPSLFVPLPEVETGIVQRLEGAAETSWGYLSRSPEIVLAMVLPIVAYLLFKRHGASTGAWTWFRVTSTLMVTFILFFAFNGLITAGLFFLPRYATLVVPFAVVLFCLVVDMLPVRGQAVVLAGVLMLCTIGVRGPFALGGQSPDPPGGERSMAFLGRIDEERAALERLASLEQEMPVYYDHFAHYAYSYPEMTYYVGPPFSGTAVALDPTWGDDLSSLPDRFAMLVGPPYLGGGQMTLLEFEATEDSDYVVSRETFGSQRYFPLRIVIVKRHAS